MNRKITIPIVVLFSILILTSVYVNPVKAVAISTGNAYSYTIGNHPQKHMTTHTATGYVFFATYNDATKQVWLLKLINPVGAGEVLDNQVINMETPYDAYGGNTGFYIDSCTTLDADEILIIGSYGQTGDAKARVAFLRYNVITHNVAYYASAALTNADGYTRSTSIYQYNGLFYIVLVNCGVGRTVDFIAIMSFNPSNNAITKVNEITETGDNSACSKVVDFQDPNDLTKIYFITSFDNVKTAKLYCSVISGTPATTLIATLNSGFCLEDGASVTDTFGVQFIQLSGGIVTDGTYFYMHFSWAYSDRYNWAGTGTRYTVIQQQRLKFNNTISSGTLLETNRKVISVNDESGSSASNNGFVWGYCVADNGSPYPDLLRVFYNNVYGGGFVGEVDLSIESWKIFDDAVFDTVQYQRHVDDIDFDYDNVAGGNQLIIKDPTKSYSFQIYSNTESYLFTGERVTVAQYTFTSTVAPLDNPMLTNKNYDITFSVYVNGIIDNLGDKYTLFINGVERGSGNIPTSGTSTGKIVFGMSVYSAGTYNIIIKVYDSGNNYITTSQQFSYTFSTSTPVNEGEESNSILIAGTAFIVAYLPAMVCIFGTGTATAGVAKQTGNGQYALVLWLSGCIVGCILGGVLGVVPTSVMILGIFMFAILAVYVFKTGNSGGQ